ncbi:right-handed parallel beta-helix repeat-containing protein [Vagococcus carniphilus]|uniref:right-handed parallel beta-helix repeat-containing protein n=1 Tax=Vagococcus carniphilus TaxID=218144 RepID=UPI00288EFFCB|nr:right-handed parallel beta-helix repeat-containing protein [Vagococcus carniphilus]MDT2830015.1 right-handed parallel beta-helix repeat-containing protein [Vagococcus carniphilus]MDT2838450.1 right-handed parallel beta-helix repeat-containing protein [Vagococcus carniphilus]MDT2855611.1 right-handed parallel beta-helix repeat-containing protein [Vagococcus carniphilus]
MNYLEPNGGASFRDTIPYPNEIPMEREGFYTDPTAVPEIENAIEKGYKDELAIRYAQFIREKMYGADVRESIARFGLWLDVRINEIEKQNLEVIAEYKEIKNLIEDLETKFDLAINGLTIDSELILARYSKMLKKTFNILSDRGDFWDEELASREVNVEWYRISDATEIEMFQLAVDHLENIGGGTLHVPNKKYVFDFNEKSTIKNPTRIFITGSNIRVKGSPKTKIVMEGLTKEYLNSIDDHNSSGRDIFTAFSFCGGENVHIENIEFEGEYTDNLDDAFRFKSPRQICVGFKGCKNFSAKNIRGKNIFGNVLNAVNSMREYDVEFKISDTFKWEDCTADHCLENGFNAMGGTKDFTAQNLRAFDCGNGLETASDGFYASNLILERNKSTNISLSGSRQVLTNSMLNEAIGNKYSANLAGYGMLVSGDGGLIFNNIQFSGNYSSCIFLYPKTRRIQGSNSRMYYNAENDKYGIMVHMQTNELGNIEGISLDNIEYKQVSAKATACFINGTNLDNVTVKNCFGTSNGNLAINIYGQNKNVTTEFNNFDKDVSISSFFKRSALNGSYGIHEFTKIPSEGDFEHGDLLLNTKAALGEWSTARCISSGSLDKCNDFLITAVAGNKDAIINKNSNYRIGMFINIDGEPSPKRIEKFDNEKIWFDTPFKNSVSNATAKTRIANIIYSQLGVNTNISTKPVFIGQMAIVGSKVYICISTAAGLDWKEINTA